MAECAGRLEADKAEAETGVVVEEANVAEPGEDLVTSSFFRKTGEESELNLVWL